MFFNILGKQLKMGLRNKGNIFWTLMYPIILGTLFYIAFGSIFENFIAEPIKTAVVFDTDDEAITKSTKEFLEGLKSGDMNLLDISYMEYDEAEALLKDDEKINGIINVNADGMLSLDILNNGVRSTIQQSIVTAYNQSLELIKKVAAEHPENLQELIKSLSKDTSYVTSKNLAGDNKDPYVNYFYNLIVMAAMFAALNSVRIGNASQANMSKVGARANVAPVKRITFQAAGLISSYIVQVATVEIAVTFLLFGLKINFGGNIFMIYLTSALATLLGVALGFCIGNIGSFSLKKKESILVWITLLSCALSGFMYGDLKIIIAENAPIINKINPAAVMTDAYYCLNMFGVGERYMQTVIYMLVLSVVLIVSGLVLGRKVSYDSI